jgi:hypothetical protein
VTKIEFGSLSGANDAREEYPEYLCSDDDRRLKTVTFNSDLPEGVEERLRSGADVGQIERESGPGQDELTEPEKSRVGPFTGDNNYRKAASVKALFRENGVDDWTSWYDPTLSVDEHRSSVLPQARRAGGGSRRDSQEATHQREQTARNAEKAVGGQCDHARDHCEHGEKEACEFLRETCGYSESEVGMLLGDDRHHDDSAEQQQLVTVGGGEYPEMGVTPMEAGALQRSWSGYKAATSDLAELLDDVRDEIVNARQAVRAINSIRNAHDQDDLHPENLHDLLESLAGMPESIPEVVTLQHFSDSELAEREPERRGTEPEPDQSPSNTGFSTDRQGTLGTGVEADQQATDKQVTLGGGDATASNEALPERWILPKQIQRGGEVSRTPAEWTAGPWSVRVEGSRGDSARGGFDVTLRGPSGTERIASTVETLDLAVEIADEFTDRLKPREATLHRGDAGVPQAAAEAKQAAIDSDGGLSNFVTIDR